MLPLRVSGSLGDVDAALLVRSLSRSRETGRLAVTDGPVSRHLFFHAGEIIFASSSDPDDGLGACLVRAGRLSIMELAALAARVSEERRLSSLLVEDKVLTPEELVSAVSGHLQEVVRSVVLGERGRYLFDFGEAPLRERILLRRDTRQLLLAILRDVESVARVSRGLRALEGRSWLAAPPEAVLELSPDAVEVAVLAGLPRPWDGLDLPRVGGLTPWQVARATWALQLVGAVHAAGQRQPTPSPASRPRGGMGEGGGG
jgi:hypothetical protein